MELYSKKKEANTWQLLTDYWKGKDRINAVHYSSFKEESEPFVLHNASIMPFVIKGLAMTETANHISGRSLILLSNENKLYNVPQNLFSARRP